MVNDDSLTRGKRGLRWKLTLSYTAVTVGALLTVEIILLVAVGVLVFALVNSGALPVQLIESVSISYTPTLRAYLSQTPPDVDGLAASLEQLGTTPGSIPFSFDATDRLFVVGPDGQLLAARPVDLFGAGQIGRPLDTQMVPGLAEPLQAALAGEDDPAKLFTLRSPGDQVVLTIPIWDADHEQVLGVLVGLADFPTLTSILGDALPVLGVSLLILTLVAGLAGTLFGYLASRGPVRRLNRLSGATQAWSRGDFTEYVDDAEGDELGQLAQQLNHMAQELEQLLETRRELAVVEERNRLARELHDSAKQLAFAASARIGGVRAILSRDPDTAAAQLAEAERLLDDLRRELTGMILQLRPAALAEEGLAAAVRDYVSEWAEGSDIVTQVQIRDARRLPAETEQPLFRILQEALANVARHSEAGNVEIALTYTSQDVTLEVNDDGRGFEAGEAQRGFGLNSMQQRAQELGGRLVVGSAPEGGTALTCTIPTGAHAVNHEVQTHE